MPIADAASLRAITRMPAPLRQQVVDQLRQSIVSGRLAPASRLVERELIAMLGVSRTVIREALRQLESEGLVTMAGNRGAAVRELTLEEAQDLYSIRAVLEGLAAKLCAEHADRQQIDRLDRALKATATAYREGHPDEILRVKTGFYDVLLEGAGSATLSSMLASLHGRIWRWRALGLSHPKRAPRRSAESLRALRAVLAAIKAHKGARAETLMRTEVMRAAAEATRLVQVPKPTA
jgi:DNA-binding GntR family transcriptional regulator